MTFSNCILIEHAYKFKFYMNSFPGHNLKDKYYNKIKQIAKLYYTNWIKENIH